mmetsp:Transcript_56267/g.131825  ORF Transcript_56267/g.131825 Transcript_56267/m.131825 type:complete len:201 (-) Transcript_56267:214-816(-)
MVFGSVHTSNDIQRLVYLNGASALQLTVQAEGNCSSVHVNEHADDVPTLLQLLELRDGLAFSMQGAQAILDVAGVQRTAHPATIISPRPQHTQIVKGPSLSWIIDHSTRLFITNEVHHELKIVPASPDWLFRKDVHEIPGHIRAANVRSVNRYLIRGRIVAAIPHVHVCLVDHQHHLIVLILQGCKILEHIYITELDKLL